MDYSIIISLKTVNENVRKITVAQMEPQDGEIMEVWDLSYNLLCISDPTESRSSCKQRRLISTPLELSEKQLSQKGPRSHSDSTFQTFDLFVVARSGRGYHPRFKKSRGGEGELS